MATTLPRWASRGRAAALESQGDYVGAARMLGRGAYGTGKPGRIRGVNAEQAMASRIAARGGDPDAVFQAAEDAEQQTINDRAAGREEAYRNKRRSQNEASGIKLLGDVNDKASEAYHIARGSSPEWAREYASAERLKRKSTAKTPAVEATASGNKGDADAFAGVEAEFTPSRRMTATGKASGRMQGTVTEGGQKMTWEDWRKRNSRSAR